MPRRYLLSEQSAAILRRLASARGGVELEDRRIAPPSSVRRPIPFDCRLGPGGEGHEDETHVYCFLPSEARLVIAADGMIMPDFMDLSGQSYDQSTGWLDMGEVTAATYVVLGAVVSTSDFSAYGHAAPLYGYSYFCLRLSAGGTFSPPTGYSSAYALVPPRVIAYVSPSSVRQLWHGVYLTTATIPDNILAGTGFTTSNPRTNSVDENENGNPNCTSLHGFKSPTKISNPYASGGTPPADSDALLVLVRRLAADEKSADLVYLPLGDLAASSGGGATGDPRDYDDIHREWEEKNAIPCPVDGYGDAAIWDACLGEWRSLRDMADIFGYALRGIFWPQGGNESSCFGSAIGDPSNAKKIDLSTGGDPQLVGDWACTGKLQVNSDLHATGNTKVKSLEVSNGNADVIGNVTATGDVSDGVGSLAALRARVAALEAILQNYADRSVAFPDGSSLTVLAK